MYISGFYISKTENILWKAVIIVIIIITGIIKAQLFCHSYISCVVKNT